MSACSRQGQQSWENLFRGFDNAQGTCLEADKGVNASLQNLPELLLPTLTRAAADHRQSSGHAWSDHSRPQDVVGLDQNEMRSITHAVPFK